MARRTPDLPADFVELLAAFARAEVRYLVIGGYAEGYHDRPRTTKDPTPGTACRCLSCRATTWFAPSAWPDASRT
ncbi:MAG TPA: hypothetical protein VMM93_07390 [Vicinamibacterales bacterium]|nr:hypothetical protein [Vicinamibacterales bacterium]